MSGRVDFTKTGKPVTHGTRNAYVRHNCRCDECREANRVACAAARAQRDPDMFGLPHGVRSTYVNWNCRCEDCCEANAASCAKYRKRVDQ